MSVLFSELLVPDWAEGPTAKIGLRDVTWAFNEAPVITYKDYKRTQNPSILVKPIEIPCHTADPELFFSEDKEVIAQAKTLCGGCPMRAKSVTITLEQANWVRKHKINLSKLLQRAIEDKMNNSEIEELKKENVRLNDIIEKDKSLNIS